MRFNLWLMSLGLTFTSVFVHAGLPGVDPAVSKLRDEFAIARVPTLNDLRLNKPWDCTDLSALGNSSRVISDPGLFKFRSVDNIIINDNTKAYVQSFVLTKDGLSGSYTDQFQYLETIRATAHGELVLEWAGQEPTGGGQAISLVNSAYYAIAYAICSPAL